MTRLTRFRSPLAVAVVAGSMALAAAPAAAANDTVALKNALYGAGYDISNVNSQMDDATRTALEKFQRDQGLAASGELNIPTKEALGMVSVQVAAAPNNSSAGSQKTSSSSSAAAEPEAAVEENADEDDDGGWSFF